MSYRSTNKIQHQDPSLTTLSELLKKLEEYFSFSFLFFLAKLTVAHTEIEPPTLLLSAL